MVAKVYLAPCTCLLFLTRNGAWEVALIDIRVPEEPNFTPVDDSNVVRTVVVLCTVDMGNEAGFDGAAVNGSLRRG